jgi:DNA repair protein RadA/Sms
VLARHAGVGLGSADVFVNVVGGVRVDEPGADLAVALAVASAARGVPLSAPAGVRAGDGAALAGVGAGDGSALAGDGAAPAGGGPPPLACFGEVGLTGELRPVAHADRRAAEAARFGLDPVLAPAGSGPPTREAGTLRAALQAAIPGPRAAAAAA